MGFVLDGFPRTLGQAKAAYDWGRGNERTFHAVLNLEVPEDELVRRLLDRGRLDDNEETIRRRLRVYADQTKPLLDFYRGRDILFEIDGTGSVDDVAARISLAIDGLDVDS
jgi:adenylate kinase